jgi:hypothetical protein
LKRLGHNIGNKNLENLRTDLLFMDKYTDPHSNYHNENMMDSRMHPLNLG